MGFCFQIANESDHDKYLNPIYFSVITNYKILTILVLSRSNWVMHIFEKGRKEERRLVHVTEEKIP